MLFWKTKPAEIEAPAPTPEDTLVQADVALREARAEYADACRCVAAWRVKHPEVVRIGDNIFRQLLPQNPEFLELTRRESQTHAAMCEAMEERARAIEQYKPQMKFIGGVRVA